RLRCGASRTPAPTFEASRKRGILTAGRSAASRALRPVAGRELDLAVRLVDLLQAHSDRVAVQVAHAASPAHEGGAERVQLDVVRQPARGQVDLEDAAEADEQAGAEEADDLALERLLPP